MVSSGSSSGSNGGGNNSGGGGDDGDARTPPTINEQQSGDGHRRGTSTLPKPTSPSHIVVGRTRVQDAATVDNDGRGGGGAVGTVLFYGNVSSSNVKVYCGVDWDDADRGRHDGTAVDGGGGLVRHFRASHPTSGSFVVERRLHFGRALTPDVVAERYVVVRKDAADDCKWDGGDPTEQHYVTTDRRGGGGAKPIEFVGQSKIIFQQQWRNLRHLSLRRMRIESVDSTMNWAPLSHVTSVDLAGNLIHDWGVLRALLSALPNAASLSLAHNRMVDESAAGDVAQACYLKIRQLNIRKCGVRRFATLRWLSGVFPNLEELCCSHNPGVFGDLVGEGESSPVSAMPSPPPPPPPCFALRRLRVLDAASCSITDQQLERLLPVCCPSVVSLLLSGNDGISAWPPPPTTAPPQNKGDVAPLPLQELTLSGKSLKSYKSLRGLLSCDLTSLRIDDGTLEKRPHAAGGGVPGPRPCPGIPRHGSRSDGAVVSAVASRPDAPPPFAREQERERRRWQR